MQLLRETLAYLWSADTAHEGLWQPDKPSIGQCATSSLVAQNLFGGELKRIKTSDVVHYFLELDGQVVDLTDNQFETLPAYSQGRQVSREDLLGSLDTRDRYEILRKRFDSICNDMLPVGDHEHIAIRDSNYVAGTSAEPEVSIFANARKDRIPLPNERMSVNQAIWMKWVNGPIVARSTVQSWHTVEFEGGDEENVRWCCRANVIWEMSDRGPKEVYLR